MLLIAVGLSTDAFAVAVSAGLRLQEESSRGTIRIALYFGGFQAGMPLVGWLAGGSLRGGIADYDHWVAFGILLIIGAKMMLEALRRDKPDRGYCLQGQTELLLLSVATSIDALAIGVSIAMQRVSIWVPAAVIGLVTGTLSAVGIELGDRLGTRVSGVAEFIGGVILCGLGIRILVSHVW